MDLYGRQNADAQGDEENPGPYTFPPTSPWDLPQYQGTGSQEYPTHFPLGTATELPNWPNVSPSYGIDAYPDTYGHAGGGDVPTGRYVYTSSPPFQGPSQDLQGPRQQELRNEQYDPGSLGSTIRFDHLLGHSHNSYPIIYGTVSSDPPTYASSHQDGSRGLIRGSNIPEDVFLNPADPARRELYHKIQRETWFIDQTQERPITADEASQIPGSVPGESVLLAFYDRIPDVQNNRTAMHCTICMQRNEDAHLYSQPDRAKVHMRHHFQLRPFSCDGRCNAIYCRQRFYSTADLHAHVTTARVKCEYCDRSISFRNLRRHISTCHQAPHKMSLKRQLQGQDFDVPQMMSGPRRPLAPSLTRLVQQRQTPDISLGGRIIRLVMYGRIPSDDVHRVWVHRQTKFSNVTEELFLAAYQIGATESFVVLEADWGPQPCWNEADLDSSIGEACQVLYVVFKRQFMRYILGVVRNSLTDFPVCISISTNASSKTISECITASHPELIGRITSITGYASGEDVSDHQLDSARIDTVSFSNLRTAIIITLDKPPDKFAASAPSHIYSQWELTLYQTELSYKPIPALLQVPFLYCERLMQQAYTLDVFALQMIHITGSTRHLIISLANEMKAVFAGEPSGVDAVLAAEGDLADLLQVAPLLSHELKTILDQISRVIDQLEEDSFSRQEAQKEIDAIFTSLCGEFPGAVTVRHSDKLFKRLGSIDHQEIQALDRHGATSPGMIPRNVGNEDGDASRPRSDQDADHEMVDSDLVGGSPARRRGRTHIGENDEDMVVDLDELEREAEWNMS